MNSKVFEELLKQLYKLAGSSDYIRDMRINESLSTLLTLLMQESWNPDNSAISKKRMELVSVKNYMDEHYVEKITLDDLEAQFFINKYYLLKIFKETYGVTISSYLISRRITRAKQLLRFTQMTIDEVGCAVGMDGAGYFSRMFKDCSCRCKFCRLIRMKNDRFILMEVVPGDPVVPVIWDEYKKSFK